MRFGAKLVPFRAIWFTVVPVGAIWCSLVHRSRPPRAAASLLPESQRTSPHPDAHPPISALWPPHQRTLGCTWVHLGALGVHFSGPDVIAYVLAFMAITWARWLTVVPLPPKPVHGRVKSYTNQIRRFDFVPIWCSSVQWWCNFGAIWRNLMPVDVIGCNLMQFGAKLVHFSCIW